MSNDKKGGSAFPVQHTNGLVHDGMALRDYFAAKAMQVALYQCDCFPDEDWRTGVAIDAYRMADAMLKERAKGWL